MELPHSQEMYIWTIPSSSLQSDGGRKPTRFNSENIKNIVRLDLMTENFIGAHTRQYLIKGFQDRMMESV